MTEGMSRKEQIEFANRQMTASAPANVKPQIMKGSPVEIIGAAHPEHNHIIGQRGTVHRFVKSRGVYQIDLAKGSRWESYPQNVRAINP